MSALDELAEIIADASAQQRVTGTATVVSVTTGSTPMRLEVSDGTDGTVSRSAIWADQGPIPQAGDRVIIVDDGSSVPVVLGRVPAPGQSADFGSRPIAAGSVTAATVTDGSGNLRTGINGAQSSADGAQSSANSANSAAGTAQSSANNAQGTADSANNSASNAQNTANSAGSSASNAQNTADSANNAASNAQNTANYAQSTANTAQGDVNSLSSTVNALSATVSSHTASIANLSTNLNALINNFNTLYNAYAGHTTHPPGNP